MTMATRVHIADPVNAERLFLHLLDCLASDPRFSPSWERPPDPGGWPAVKPGPLSRGKATYKHVHVGDVMYHRADNGEPVLEQQAHFASTVGQGLAAIVEVTYAEDGPLVWPSDEYAEEGETWEGEPLRTHLVSVDFDTSYGYKDANGAGCGDLHAFLLREVARYLDDQATPVKWMWHHEERGTWHNPDEITLRGDPDRSVLNATAPSGSSPKESA